MSLLPGLLFMRPSAGAEAAGGQFVTHPGSMRSSFPPGTVAARGQDDDCPTHRQIPPALPCILYVYAPFSQSRHMSWTVHGSPEHPAWPGGAFQLPSKHKLILEVQTTFPLPSKLCSHVHIQHEFQDNLFPLCLANFTSYCRKWPLCCFAMTWEGGVRCYSHLFQFRHKQHLWELWCIPH